MKNIAVLLLLAVFSGCYHRDATITGFEGKTMPSFNLLLSDSSTRLNTQAIPAGKPIVLCYVGTHCPYSRAEIQDIVDNIDDFKNMRVYFFTTDDFRAMKSIYNHYQLSKYPNVSMGVDSAGIFAKYFQAVGVPYTAIYTPNKKLLKAYEGQVGAGIIRDAATD